MEPISWHAKFIASAGPTYQYASQEVSENKFLETYIPTLERYASRPRSSHAAMFRDLVKKIEEDCKNESRYRVVDVISLMDRAGIYKSAPRFYTKACSAAFLTMEWIAAPGNGLFSASKSASFFIEDIAQVEFQDLSEYRHFRNPNIEPFAFVVEFPMHEMLYFH